MDSTTEWIENEDTDMQTRGYKIVGDNLDKTFRPQCQTAERITQTMYYFHSYAVKDIIPSSHLSNIPTEPPLRVDLGSIMYSESCHWSMLTTFAVLVSQ